MMLVIICHLVNQTKRLPHNNIRFREMRISIVSLVQSFQNERSMSSISAQRNGQKSTQNGLILVVKYCVIQTVVPATKLSATCESNSVCSSWKPADIVWLAVLNNFCGLIPTPIQLDSFVIPCFYRFKKFDLCTPIFPHRMLKYYSTENIFSWQVLFKI